MEGKSFLKNEGHTGMAQSTKKERTMGQFRPKTQKSTYLCLIILHNKCHVDLCVLAVK